MERELVLIRLSSLGDVAMLVPVLVSFHQNHPQTSIRVISQRQFQPIFQNLNFVRFQAISEETNKPKLLELIRFGIQLSLEKNIILLDLHDVLRTKILRLFSRLFGRKIGVIDKGRSEKKHLISLQGKDIYPLKATVERYADVIRQVGFSFELIDKISLKKKTIQPNLEAIRIGIAPFSKHSSKEYDINLLREVLEILQKNESFYFFIYGFGKAEYEKAEALIQDIPRAENTIGKLNFGEELEHIGTLDIMLSMDSGNGHLAAMYGIPVVTLWGTTHPYLGFAPYGQPLSYSLFPDPQIYPHLPTSVFGLSNNAAYDRAIDSIQPSAIADKIYEIIGTISNSHNGNLV